MTSGEEIERMRRELFDRDRLSIRPLGERVHDLRQADILKRPGGERIGFEHPALPVLAKRTVAAARADRPNRRRGDNTPSRRQESEWKVDTA